VSAVGMHLHGRHPLLMRGRAIGRAAPRRERSLVPSYAVFVHILMADLNPVGDDRRMCARTRRVPLRSSLRPVSTRRRRLLSLGIAALSFATGAASFPPPVVPSDQDILVRVQQAGAEIVVNVDCPVRAPVPIVWDVLTDYDHMAEFVSSLQFSGIERRTNNVLTVRQIGKIARGLFTFSFDNVREIELVPFAEIRSRLVSGDLKASAFTTRIVDAHGLVHVVNSGRYTPNVWVPPLVGPVLIEGETRRQYGEIRTEILRRAGRYAASPRGNEPVPGAETLEGMTRPRNSSP
jgi:hypothetical protein